MIRAIGEPFKAKNSKRPGWVSKTYSFKISIHGKKKTFTGWSDKALTRKLQADLVAELQRHEEGLPILTQGKSSLLLEHLGKLGVIKAIRQRTMTQLIADFADFLKQRNSTSDHSEETKKRLTKIITVTQVRDLSADRLRRAIQELDVGPVTKNHYITACRSFGRWLEDSEAVGRNPLRDLKKIKVNGDVRVQRRPLTVDQVKQLVESTLGNDNDRLMPPRDRAALYLLAFATGLRANELASLKPESFDFAVPGVYLSAASTKNKKAVLQPIVPSVVADVQRWVATKPAGLPLWPRKWFRRAAEMLRDDLTAAGIEYKTEKGQADFHALRHSYITALAAAGLHPKKAQSLARHSTIHLTMQCYTHLDASEAAKDLAVFGSFGRLFTPDARTGPQEDAGACGASGD